MIINHISQIIVKEKFNKLTHRPWSTTISLSVKLPQATNQIGWTGLDSDLIKKKKMQMKLSLGITLQLEYVYPMACVSHLGNFWKNDKGKNALKNNYLTSQLNQLHHN